MSSPQLRSADTDGHHRLVAFLESSLRAWMTRQKAKCSRASAVCNVCCALRTHVSYAEYRRYDEFFALSRRRFVPPNFAEMRHVLNIAQVSDCTSVIVNIQM